MQTRSCRTSIITPHMRKMMKSLMAGKDKHMPLHQGYQYLPVTTVELRRRHRKCSITRRTMVCRCPSCWRQWQEWQDLKRLLCPKPRGNIPMTLELSPKHHIVTTRRPRKEALGAFAAFGIWAPIRSRECVGECSPETGGVVLPVECHHSSEIFLPSHCH